MGFFLRVESCPEKYSARGLALLDPQVMKRQGLRANRIVEINNQFHKRVLAKIAPPLAADRGLGIIRIDQYLRQSIKALVGDQVEVEAAEVSPVNRVVLAPFLDLSQVENLARFLRENFAARGLMVTPGAVLYATVPGGSSGCAFKVLDLSPGPGLITPKTSIELKYIFTVWPGMTEEVTFEDVGGLSAQIRQIRELVELPLRFPDAFRKLGISPPRGIVFYGPPGAGKTHLAKAIANNLDARFLYINGPDVVSSTYGETEANLRKIFREASHHLPSIIFIDELDIIAPKRGESGTQADTRMATQFLELMDGLKRVEGVMVIGTTNRIDSLDPAVRRPGRFDREIYIGPPDRTGRLQILRIHTRGMPLSPAAEGFLEELSRRTHGFVGADLMELCREAGLTTLRRQLSPQWNGQASALSVSLDRLIIEPGDLQSALSRLRPSAMRESLTSVPEIRWEDIGGLEEVKRQLREIVEEPMLHPESFRAMNLKPPVGILLYGPPGAGKTLLAQALASESQANFISVKGTEIFSKWLGESEEGIRHIFRVARQVAPAVIFFDQIDALAPVRRDDSGRAGQRVVNQLLAELDGLEPLTSITVVAATNRLDLIDPALLRPGRFGVHIHVPLPDIEDRKNILRNYLRAVPTDGQASPEGMIRVVAEQTPEFSGAELQAVCQEAKTCALREAGFAQAQPLRLSHFEEALKRVKASRLLYENARR